MPLLGPQMVTGSMAGLAWILQKGRGMLPTGSAEEAALLPASRNPLSMAGMTYANQDQSFPLGQALSQVLKKIHLHSSI